MSQITCPHCGLSNAAISAYCSRCARPLQDGATPPALSSRRPPPASPDPRTPPIERIRRNAQLSEGPTVVQPKPIPGDPRHNEPTVVRSAPRPLEARGRESPASASRPEPTQVDKSRVTAPRPEFNESDTRAFRDARLHGQRPASREPVTDISPPRQTKDGRGPPTRGDAASGDRQPYGLRDNARPGRPAPSDSTDDRDGPRLMGNEPLAAARPSQDVLRTRDGPDRLVQNPNSDSPGAGPFDDLESVIRRRLELDGDPVNSSRRPIQNDPTMVRPSPIKDAPSEPTVIRRDPLAKPVNIDTDPTIIPAARPSFARLALALLCDAMVVLTVAGMSVATEMLLFAGRWPAEKVGFVDALAVWLSLYPGTALRAAIITGLFAVAYSSWGAWRGRTLGQQIAGLTALRLSGYPIHPAIAIWRGLLSMVSICAFGAGFFWILVDLRRRTLHDVLSNCVVVIRQARSGA